MGSGAILLPNPAALQMSREEPPGCKNEVVHQQNYVDLTVYPRFLCVRVRPMPMVPIASTTLHMVPSSTPNVVVAAQLLTPRAKVGCTSCSTTAPTPSTAACPK